MANKKLNANLKKEQERLLFKALQSQYAAYQQTRTLSGNNPSEHKSLNYNMWYGLPVKKQYSNNHQTQNK